MLRVFFRFLALSLFLALVFSSHYFAFPSRPLFFLFYRTKCSTQRNAAPLQVPPVVAAGVRLQQRGVPVVVPVVLVLVLVVVCAAVEWPPSCSYGVLALIIQRWAAPPLVASITIRTVPCSPHHPRTRTHCTTLLAPGKHWHRPTTPSGHREAKRDLHKNQTTPNAQNHPQKERKRTNEKECCLHTQFHANGPPSCVVCLVSS